ncbi:MAG: hypothetical protein AAGF06_08490, partial [Pseudomonadota bacterium]
CNTPPNINITPAMQNTATLCAESQINPGTLLASDAMTLPAPNVTNNAGNAQHTSVEVDANKVRQSMNGFIKIPANY